MSQKRIVIAGGSGFLGRNLQSFFQDNDCSVHVLTRNPKHEHDIRWDAKSLGEWSSVLDGAFALINMAGRTVDCRYNEANKSEILSSRIESTKVLHPAVAGCEQPPSIWLNSSTSTIYNDTRGDLPANTEANNIGDDFSMGVSELILKSRKVAPERLLNAGFEFEFPEASGLLENLFTKR